MYQNDSSQSNEFNNMVIDLNSGETLQTVNDKITINANNPNLDEGDSEKLSKPFSSDNLQNKEKVDNSSELEEKKEEQSTSFVDKLLCFLRFLRPYYSVNFNDIKTRIKYSFLPINNVFMEIADSNPDLYGPFWIYTTLIYVIAAGGALSYYFSNSSKNYFQMFVPVAGSILYSFGFGFPLALWICMKIFKLEMKYISLVCLYGYSLSCFIPVLFLCSTGFSWLQWILLIYGIGNSTVFILINLWNKIKALEDKSKYIFFGIFGGGQIILFLILKFYFFGS